jgi:hypothetical protein
MDKLIKYCLVVEFTLAYEDVIKEAVSLAETHFIYQDRMWRIYDMMIQVCVCVCVCTKSCHMHCCTCTRLDQAYLLTRIMRVCMQEGMDERFAQSMLMCMHKSIVHSNLHEAALTLGVPRSSAWPAHRHVRIQVTRGINQLQRSLSSSSRLDDEALHKEPSQQIHEPGDSQTLTGARQRQCIH